MANDGTVFTICVTVVVVLVGVRTRVNAPLRSQSRYCFGVNAVKGVIVYPEELIVNVVDRQIDPAPKYAMISMIGGAVTILIRSMNVHHAIPFVGEVRYQRHARGPCDLVANEPFTRTVERASINSSLRPFICVVVRIYPY